jgi:hypothetical protein
VFARACGSPSAVDATEPTSWERSPSPIEHQTWCEARGQLVNRLVTWATAADVASGAGVNRRPTACAGKAVTLDYPPHHSGGGGHGR